MRTAKTMSAFDGWTSSERQTVLVVDDDATNRMILKSILDRHGCETLEAEDGRQALAVAERGHPDLILLDIMMPEMDGYETCQHLKSNPTTAAIPVIFVTALSDTESVVKGFELGAVDYLAKPFKHREVLARVTTHLALKASTDKMKRYSVELERLVAEEANELVKAERQAAFGQLVQGIVHNLKGPLTAIHGCVHTVKAVLAKIAAVSDQDATAKVAVLDSWLPHVGRAMDTVGSSAKRLNDMLNQMMSRSSSDQAMQVETFDLNEKIRAELDFLTANLHFKHNIKKEVVLWAEPLPIRALSAEIGHIFDNLIRNAIDALHGRSAPLIIVRTRAKNGFAQLIVEDSGEGIPREHLDKIFDPFFTTKAKVASCGDLSNRPVGTGLGLYMCQRSVKELGGYIEVISEVQVGTRVEVNIPLAVA